MRLPSADEKHIKQTSLELQERGYKHAESVYSDSFGNRLERFEGARLEILITKDRDFWEIDVRPTLQGAGWRSLEIWSLCIGMPARLHESQPPDVRMPPIPTRLGPQLDYLRQHLSALEAACHPNRVDSALQCLAAAEDVARLSQFLGLPDDHLPD
jgi:hypothetical protein